MADSDIQITEIMYDPAGVLGSDVDYEWVELYNDGATPVSLDGWTIADGASGLTQISPGFTLQPGQYGIVYNSGKITEAEFTTAYGALPVGAVFITHIGDGSSGTQWAGMSNSGEQITLSNGSTVIEQFTYPDTATEGQSLELGGTDGSETFSVQSSPTIGYCFAKGTMIAAPQGDVAVEDLQIGDLIHAEDGRAVAVKWIGRQTAKKRLAGAHMQPVRISANALGGGLPNADLVVTADHGMIIDGFVINASALVNGDTIHWVPMADLPEHVTYYHVETEAHDVILANGALAETFVDAASRASFDNYQEYLGLYGAERVIPEMNRPRISAARLVPTAIKTRLGLSDGPDVLFDVLSA